MAAHVTLIGSTDRHLQEMLKGCGASCASIPVAGLEELARSRTPQEGVLVIDIRESGSLPPAVNTLKLRHPSVSIVVVAARLEPEVMLEAMRSGVTEWLAEPLIQQDLEAALLRVTSQQAPVKVGQIFAFLGAKGGVGTTTVAVNTATSLASEDRGQVLLIDLHLAYGDAGLFLGANPKFSVLDALENTHRLDEAFFRSLIVHTKAGPDLLASSDRAMAGPADVRRIRAVLEFAAQRYRYIIVDCPRSDTAVLDALETATKIVLVANQELSTVRSCARMAETLRQRHGANRVSIVITRYDSESEIGHDDVERFVGGSIKHIFPSNYRLSMHALNKGRPLVLDNHSKLAGSIAEFAHDLAGIAPEAPESKRPTGLFGRFGGKR